MPDLAPLDGAASQAHGLDKPSVLVAHQLCPLQHKPAFFPVPETNPLEEARVVIGERVSLRKYRFMQKHATSGIFAPGETRDPPLVTAALNIQYSTVRVSAQHHASANHLTND